jgi:hypothetical protein
MSTFSFTVNGYWTAPAVSELSSFFNEERRRLLTW